MKFYKSLINRFVPASISMISNLFEKMQVNIKKLIAIKSWKEKCNLYMFQAESVKII